MKKRILIVDDEVKVLQAIHRMLVSMNSEWHVEYRDSGAQALQILNKMPFDVVVADLFMPGMGGDQLLREVMVRHPHATRIILCWQSDQVALSKAFSVAHQFLIKPCDASVLIETVARAVSQSDKVPNDKVKKLLSQMRSIPSLPSVYVELTQEMRAENPSFQRAGEIISKDTGMTAKILQLVNSEYFGLPIRVTNPAEAIIYLGLETVTALVLSLQVFSSFDKTRLKAVDLDGFWTHCWETGILSKRIGITERRDLRLSEQAFVTGLLHDVGKLVIASSLPEPYQNALRLAREERMPLWMAEREVFSCSHAEVGGHLLSLWGLPNPIVEGVTYHHTPSESLNRSLSPVIAVHAANALNHEYHGDLPDHQFGGLDLDYILALGFGERFEAWRDECAALYEPITQPIQAELVTA